MFDEEIIILLHNTGLALRNPETQVPAVFCDGLTLFDE